MSAPTLFYTVHAINPYRYLLDHLRMLPGGGDVGGVVRHVFAWSEAAESLRKAEETLATVGRDYGRELSRERKALAALRPTDPARRDHERALAHLERGGYETLTWRLQVAAREVARQQARLDEIDAMLRQVAAVDESVRLALSEGAREHVETTTG
jgi:hypothetical protein